MTNYLRAFFLMTFILSGSVAIAGGIAVGGGSPLKLVDDLQNPDKRIFVVDDSMFIEIIGLVGSQQHEFINNNTNLDLQGLKIKDGNSYVSAFRYLDGAEVYFVNKSAYESVQTGAMSIEELIKQLDENSVAVILSP